ASAARRGQVCPRARLRRGAQGHPAAKAPAFCCGGPLNGTPGISGARGVRPPRRRCEWQPGREPRPEPVRSCSKAAARSQPLSACHDRATRAENSAWPLRCCRVAEQKLRVSRLDSLAYSVPEAATARAVSPMVAVLAAAPSQHLSTTDLLAPALCFAVWSPSQTGLRQGGRFQR